MTQCRDIHVTGLISSPPLTLIGGSLVTDARRQELVRGGGSANLRDKAVGIYAKAGFPANPEAPGSWDQAMEAICVTAWMAPEAAPPLPAAWRLLTQQARRFWACRRSVNRCVRLVLLKI